MRDLESTSIYFRGSIPRRALVSISWLKLIPAMEPGKEGYYGI